MTARLSDFDLREGLSDCDLRDFSSCFVKVNITAAAAADKILELEQVCKPRLYKAFYSPLLKKTLQKGQVFCFKVLTSISTMREKLQEAVSNVIHKVNRSKN